MDILTLIKNIEFTMELQKQKILIEVYLMRVNSGTYETWNYGDGDCFYTSKTYQKEGSLLWKIKIIVLVYL